MFSGYFFKAFCFISLILMLLFEGCNKKNPVDADEDLSLLGKWELNLMRSEAEGVVETLSTTQLDSMGIIWSLEFKDDNSVVQITNMSGPVVIMNGTWRKTDKELILTLTVPTGSQASLTYDYCCDGDLLELDWAMSAGPKLHAEFLPEDE